MNQNRFYEDLILRKDSEQTTQNSHQCMNKILPISREEKRFKNP